MLLIVSGLENQEPNSRQSSKPSLGPLETSHGMEIAQLLLSLLHAWGMDNDLDHVCQVKLGLLRPLVTIVTCFRFDY